MIIAATSLLGAILGGFTAKNRGGAGLDIAQYTAAFAIAGAILGLFATVALHRMI